MPRARRPGHVKAIQTSISMGTADGKPDFSGLWENAPIGSGGGRRGGPPLATFFNIGAGFPGGLPFRPWAKELLDKRRADNDKDNPDAHCLPMGLLQFHEHPQPRKIVQTKDVLLMIWRASTRRCSTLTSAATRWGRGPSRSRSRTAS